MDIRVQPSHVVKYTARSILFTALAVTVADVKDNFTGDHY